MGQRYKPMMVIEDFVQSSKTKALDIADRIQKRIREWDSFGILLDDIQFIKRGGILHIVYLGRQPV